MEKYGEVGVTNIENPQILSLNPFARIAKRPCIMKGIFKSPEAYNEAVKDLENELYKIGKKMEGLIFVIIVVGIFFYILVVLPKKEKRNKENYDLSKYVSSKYGVDVETATHEEIADFLSKPGVRKEAEERRNFLQKKRQEFEDQQKKALIVHRVYSYKYEDVIYEIFAPYAKNNMDINTYRQRWTVDVYLEFSFVAYEMSHILRISESSANDLLREFAENGLVDTSTQPHSSYLYCSMGCLLLYNWDIISKHDKNFSSWIDSHFFDIEPREKVEERRKEFIRISL